MAAPGWKKLLPNHPLFGDLFANSAAVPKSACLKNILTVHDNVLYIWDEFNSDVKSVNLLSFWSKTSRSSGGAVTSSPAEAPVGDPGEYTKIKVQNGHFYDS